MDPKNSTLSTSLPPELADSEKAGRGRKKKGRQSRGNRVVEEFLHDGGSASLERFLQEFPEAGSA